MNANVWRMAVTYLGLCFLAGSLAGAARLPQAKAVEAELQQVWTGTLVDAACKASDPAGKCEVTDQTKAFGLQSSDGKYYKFDGDGNSKVSAALHTASTKTGVISATVTGSMDGDTIKVRSIQVQ